MVSAICMRCLRIIISAVSARNEKGVHVCMCVCEREGFF